MSISPALLRRLKMKSVRKTAGYKFQLNNNELNSVAGGTFTPNKYSQLGYNTFGISTSYHFFAGDEFKFNGQIITYEQANKIMEIGNRVMTSLNSGYKGNDRIGPEEPAFIRAFNLQLKLQMPEVGLWNGKKGYIY
jgi:hypothetical protein